MKEQLQTISDVSSVSIWGEKRYSMRLWLDPVKMAGYGITPVDVKNAVDNENVELPSGSIEGNTTELTIRTLGLMHTADEFNDLIVKEENNRIVRFSDIGRAELGPADIKSYMKMNGVPMVGVVVIPQPGANHIEIADAVYQRMEQMKKDLPEDVHYNYGFDNTKFIRASINEVKSTVYEAFVLVIIIIFLFLRDWRVTLMENPARYMTKNGPERSGNRRSQRNFLCRYFHHYYAGSGILPYRLYGWNDGTIIP